MTRAKTTDVTIGELLFSDQHPEQAIIHCYSAMPVLINLYILDKLGHSFDQKKIGLSAGENEVSFSLNRLSPGDYNAWITVGDKMFIRSFHLQPRHSAPNFLQRWLAFFL